MPTASGAPLRKESVRWESRGFVTKRTAIPLCPNVSNKVFPQAEASNNKHGDFSTIRTLPIQPFQQERDADADKKD
jgi:hypothetical protein